LNTIHPYHGNLIESRIRKAKTEQAKSFVNLIRGTAALKNLDAGGIKEVT
jgi:hypothetical protein